MSKDLHAADPSIMMMMMMKRTEANDEEEANEEDLHRGTTPTTRDQPRQQVSGVNFMDRVKDGKVVLGIFNKIRRRVRRGGASKKNKDSSRSTINGNTVITKEENHEPEKKNTSNTNDQDFIKRGSAFDTFSSHTVLRNKEAGELILVQSQCKNRHSNNEEIEISFVSDDEDDDNDNNGGAFYINTGLLPQGSNRTNRHIHSNSGSSMLNRVMHNTPIGQTKGGLAGSALQKKSLTKLAATTSMFQTKKKNKKQSDKALAWLGSPIDNANAVGSNTGHRKTITKRAKISLGKTIEPFFGFDCNCASDQAVKEPKAVKVKQPPVTLPIEIMKRMTMTEEERLALEKRKWHRDYLQKAVQKYLPHQHKNGNYTIDYGHDNNSIQNNHNEDEEDDEATLNPYDTIGEKIYLILDEEDIRPPDLDDSSRSAIHESSENVSGDEIHVYAYSRKNDGHKRNQKSVGDGDDQSAIEESFEIPESSFVTEEAIQGVYENLLKKETDPEAKDVDEADQHIPFDVDSDAKTDVNVEPFLFEDTNFDAPAVDATNSGDVGYDAEKEEENSTLSLFDDLEESYDEFPVPQGFDLVEELQPLPPPSYPSNHKRSGVPAASTIDAAIAPISGNDHLVQDLQPTLPPPYPTTHKYSSLSAANASDAALTSIPESSYYGSTVVIQNGNKSNDQIFVIEPNSFSMQNEVSNTYPEHINTRRNISSEHNLDNLQLFEDTSFLSYDIGTEENKVEKEETLNRECMEEGHSDIPHVVTDNEDDVPFDEFSALDDDGSDQQSNDAGDINYVSLREIMDRAERKIEELEYDDEEEQDEAAKSRSYHEDDSRTYTSSTYRLPYKNHMPSGVISGCIGLDITQEIVRGIDMYIDGYDGRPPRSDDEDEEGDGVALLIDGEDDDDVSSY